MSDRKELIVVTGAGGFIGGHLVGDLLRQGYENVRAIDIKPFQHWYQLFAAADNRQGDLKERAVAEDVCEGASLIYNLAADMGGMGFIETHKAECMLSVLINTNMLMAAQRHGARRFLFASSACVYNAGKQMDAKVTPLKESDAYPALAEDGYGWEKLFSERMSRHFREDFGLITRIPRFHNVYGPEGTYDGGREKAPAAICRKIIEAKLSGRHEIEIWGDGEQTRSFMYIDDCVKGSQLIMASEYPDPVNLGSDELVTINRLVDVVEEIARIKVKRTYKLDAPKGVRGRNSNNELIKQVIGWAPEISLHVGIEKTYRWIYDRMARSTAGRSERRVAAQA
jgi:GDP-D-mannose 3',5'-epimerase